jgi:nicotinate-nucleotide adenylyltransferase
MTLGVLGGTFDPVHGGHLAIARAAQERFAPERFLLMPAWQPPHKPGEVITPWHHRFAMAVLACQDIDGVEASAAEGLRRGPSFTVETLEALRRDLEPDDPLLFLMGADSLAELHLWKEHRRLLDLAHLVVAPRPGTDRDRIRSGLEPGLAARWVPLGAEERAAGGSLEPAGQIFWMEMPPVDLSGSRIRDRVRSGEPLGGLVPPAVAAYIFKYRIYPAPRRTRSS